MPELPEVESVRLNLEKNVKGKTILRIHVLAKKQLIGDMQYALGQTIVDLERIGKYLALRLSNGYYLNVHLKMTGQFLYAKDQKHTNFPHSIPFTSGHQMPSNTTRIIIEFTDQSILFYNDLRKFGWIKITETPEFPTAPDVLSKQFTRRYFCSLLVRSRRPIKIILLDQEKLAGIGNIYANEVLFAAKIHPLQQSYRLTGKQIDELYGAIIRIIKKAIKRHGTSASDEAFILPDSTKGRYQNLLMVYDREGKPCKVCGSIIRRIKQHGRSSYSCSKCQSLND